MLVTFGIVGNMGDDFEPGILEEYIIFGFVQAGVIQRFAPISTD
jgi:hypothetical protein